MPFSWQQQHRTILQRLRQMRRLNLFASRQIGNCARKVQNTMISTHGTSMWMSMQSRSGPDIRFWYLVTTARAHPQAFCGVFSHPHGQGYTQSNMFLLQVEKQTADLMGKFQDQKFIWKILSTSPLPWRQFRNSWQPCWRWKLSTPWQKCDSWNKSLLASRSTWRLWRLIRP